MKKDWTYKKLGEVCEKITDGSHNPPKGVMYSNFRMLSSQNIFNHYIDYNAGVRYVSEVDYNVENRRTSLQADDVLMTIVGTIGRSCVVSDNDKNIVLQRSVAVLRPKKDIVLSHYLSYSIHGLNEKINKEAHGIAQKGIYLRQLSDISIPIPPLSIQRSIVSELDLLHSVIEKKQEQLRALDNLAQSLFYQMFGDPITNPMGWQVKKLGEVGMEKLSYGSGASAIDFDKEVRYIRITDINDDGSLNNNKVSPSICEDKYLLHNGDILFARTGATVGKTYLHQKSNIKCIYAGYLIRFIPNIDIINPLYAFHFTKTQYYHDFVAQVQRAVAQPNINAQQYSNLPLPLPPLSLQQSFAAKVSAIEAQKQAISQSIKNVESLLAQRMDHYFSSLPVSVLPPVVHDGSK